MRPITLSALLLAGVSLLAGDPAKDVPKFSGNDYQKYWMDACARCHGANGSGRDNSCLLYTSPSPRD